jgi:microcystin degradation protein MlrC
MVKLPLLIGGEAAVTEVEPAKSRYAMLPDIDRRPGIITSSILIGCAWTDSIHTGVAAVVSGSDVGAITSAADELAESLWTKRSDFAIDSHTAGIDESVRIAHTKTVRPVFISDSGDNTTAGAAGDSPIFLRYLCKRAAQDCLVAGITDPAAVEACRKAKIGEKVGLALGGKLDMINSEPFVCEGVVRLMSGTNDSNHRDPRVLVRIGTVDVVIQSDRRPFTRLEHFTNLKIKPAKYEIIVVKEGYLFPELRDYAPFHIMALSPGFGDQRLERLPFKHLRRPIYPIDDLTSWRE